MYIITRLARVQFPGWEASISRPTCVKTWFSTLEIVNLCVFWMRP